MEMSTGTVGRATATAHITSISGAPSSLRAEFEPKLISPYGLHQDHASCAQSWDECAWPDAELRREIGVATVFLSRCTPTATANMGIGSSYALKHLCRDWWAATRGGGGGYMLNGAFVMAAHRLGLKMHVPDGFGYGRRTFFSPYLGIATRSVEVLRKEAEKRS